MDFCQSRMVRNTQNGVITLFFPFYSNPSTQTKTKTVAVLLENETWPFDPRDYWECITAKTWGLF